MHKKISAKLISLALAAFLAIACVGMSGCGNTTTATKSSEKTTQQSATTAYATQTPATADEYVYTGETTDVAIDVENYGEITLCLYNDVAPITVANFVKLANEGFYDGLTFHRIMEGFMIQGGDPLGTGMGGSDETIKGEFSMNGVENNLSHKRGVISMARANDPNSASSQFFIVQQDSEFLDDNYAAFGVVTDGMDVVDKIAADAKPTDNNGTIEKSQQPVIKTIKVLDAVGSEEETTSE